MKKKRAAPVFKAYIMDQMSLLPPSLEELIPGDHVVRVVNRSIEQIDLKVLEEGYKGGGTSSYHPKMLLKVLVYAYSQRIYSSRQIAKALRENVNFMWLSGGNRPDYRTLNIFRSSRLKPVIDEVFAEVVEMLVEAGYVRLEHYFVDGTKIEANANAHKVVWAKRTAKNKARLHEQIQELLKEIDEANEEENAEYGEDDLEELGGSGSGLDAEKIKAKIDELNERLKKKPDQRILKQGIRQLEKKYLERQMRYEAQEKKLAGRNSYSKTDEEATCMRMKEDRAVEQPLPKPAYNVQLGTEGQFIVGFSLHQRAGDTDCLIPHLENMKAKLGRLPRTIVADAGYGSEENYAYLEDHHLENYVKYNTFHREQIHHRKPELVRKAMFRSETFPYDPQKDEFICPADKRLVYSHTIHPKTDTHYPTERRIYECSECANCPLKPECTQAKGNRQIQFSPRLQRFRQQARLNLTSDHGITLRARRSTEVETVFGHIKHNLRFRRFMLRGLQKTKTEWGLISIAHNLQKLAAN